MSSNDCVNFNGIISRSQIQLLIDTNTCMTSCCHNLLVIKELRQSYHYVCNRLSSSNKLQLYLPPEIHELPSFSLKLSPKLETG